MPDRTVLGSLGGSFSRVPRRAGNMRRGRRLSERPQPGQLQPQQPPPQQPPPPPDDGAGAEDEPPTATVDRSFTVSSWPAGQAAGAADSAIGRLSSKVSPQLRQRYS